MVRVYRFVGGQQRRAFAAIMVSALALAAPSVSCKEPPKSSVGPLAADESADARLQAQFNDASRLARGGDLEGYRSLYRIAESALSAELGLSAQDLLLGLLYDDPTRWLQAFSSMDGPKLRKYLGSRGLVPVELPKGVKSHKQFAAAVVGRLRSVPGDDSMRSLASFVIEYYESHPFPEEP